ncbi:DNA/RNA non-specific endonuclease [Chitinophaga sp. Cy-1792]|uniref:DNA/RNA non-specific endonuclease n=1 Tax=Chitinophaga sp. Cy-1792 TaxID=2608339 RepID=UPI00141FB946|nr:DNA/RNA non-specific endonuclease [Chitinophaga sp. Cy-1792]NIG54372.1 DNA/RNA non-specific endonuclease [Chitinophaga sp. Cy-1792]
MPKKKSKSSNSSPFVIILAVVAVLVTYCTRKFTSEKEKDIPKKTAHKKTSTAKKKPPLLYEDFETDGPVKENYNTETITLSSGSWTLKDAVIGAKDEDHKQGSQALRIRGGGSATMNFDVNVSGTVTVTLKHAAYGTDAGGNWELWASVNKGQRFLQVGNAVKTSSPTLQTSTFTISTEKTVRLQIRNPDKDNGRINFDALTVVFSSNATTSPDAGSGSKGASTGNEVAGDNDNILLGNPSNAQAALVMPDNYLMDKGYYKLSYNRERGGPNWVSWHVGSDDLGPMSRANDFRPDADMPDNWYQVTQSSYIGSGFDRGHNCPSGDRTFSRDANEATFLMTNMIPQAPMHNQHLWANLENYTRSLVKDGNEVYIIMGSYGSGGMGSKGLRKKIDRDNITVPDHIWKVIVVIPEGNNDLKRINKNTRIIAVNTPNKNDVSPKWNAYLTSVDEIEKATNLKLLSKLPESVRAELVKKIDSGD